MLHYYGYVLYTYLFIKLISLLMHKIVPHPYLCKLSPEVFFGFKSLGGFPLLFSFNPYN